MPKLFEHPFLGRGFRPFFLLGGLYAVLSVLLWLLQMRGTVFPAMPFDDPVLWHGHEMVFGFTMAIVAGFLLTAVANWTGGAPARQIHLAGLCAIWLAGRIAMNLDIDLWLTAALQLLFIPALAASLAIPLLKSWNKRNFVFLFMLTVLFLCNLSVFVWQDRLPLYIAIFVIMAMISLIGGRIIPAFTVAALHREGIGVQRRDQYRTDMIALFSLFLVIAAMPVFGVTSEATGIFSIAAALVHGLRLRYYHTKHVWHDPLLWSLHMGYIWLVAGLALFGLASFDVVPLSPALHALTTGAIGTMTLSMMVRVALGHTGRSLQAGMATNIAFIMMQAAAVIRVFFPVFLPDYYTASILYSGLLWSGAFALYLFLYAPYLWMPRPDGRAP